MNRTWIVPLLALAVVATSPPARADGQNEIRAVTFDDANGITRVHVRGAETPTFTVYKLERPSRVVIDVPRAKLADALRGHEGATVWTPSTWAVSSIAAQQLDDGGAVVRVIVTLARPGRYDVKTDGNEVVVVVMPRDPAPKTASPAELERAQADSERSRKQAAQAEEARAAAERTSAAAQADARKAKDTASAAQAEAERLRKTAAEQATRAAAAQRAVDDAKRLQQQNAATAADLERAKANAIAAKQEAERAKAAATEAQDEAARTRSAADKARRDAIAEAERARTQAAAAKAQLDAARAQAERANAQADAAKAEAAKAHDDAARSHAAATQELERTRAEAKKVKTDLDAARGEAELAKREAAAKRAEADAIRAEAEAARGEAAKAKDDATTARARAARAETVAEREKAAAAQAKLEAQAARGDAEKARAAAATDKQLAEADKRKAEAARADAERMLRDARTQLATLDKKQLAAQDMEDKARAANAAALAREEAAREAVAKAASERQAAETAAKRAQEARDRSSNQAASDRAKATAEARAAEQRLASARRATEDAELQRKATELAAAKAKQDLARVQGALATVEQQRTAAESAASAAARKRSEAEAAASDASRRRDDAELAAQGAVKKRDDAERAARDAARLKNVADRQRAEAEAQRVAAEQAAKAASAAKDAAEQQRAIAEAAAAKALGAKRDAETSLAELTTRRQAAERAASALEQRTAAEAKAQAELSAAQARKAGDAELARVRAEAARLADERKRAETELADRRKAVARQQAESARLESAAAQAHDAAEREERRRDQLAKERVAEEQALARIKAQKAQVASAKPAAGTSPAPAPVATAPVATAPTAPTATKPQPVVAAATKPVVAPTAAATKPVVAPTAAPTPASTTKPGKVRDIGFSGDDNAAHVDVAIAGEATVTLGEVTAQHVELIFDRVELGAKLERTLDVSRFGSPVKSVSSYRDRRTPDRVRLVAELSRPALPTFDRDASGVRWHLVASEPGKRAVSHAHSLPTPVVGGFGAASTPLAQQSVAQVPPQQRGRRVYHGATIDLDFKDAPIHDLLRVIADTGHVNIVIPDTIDAKVTVKLKRVPWDQALDVILASHGLGFRREGNLYRIANQKELDAEDQAAEARREQAIKAEAPRPQVVTLNYASADELKQKLEKMLSPKGSIEVDSRTNALIINDVLGNRTEIARLAFELDTQTPQISIEARIVEARSTFLRQIGVQWGGSAIAGANGGNATGLVWPSSINIRGGNEDQNTRANGVSLPSDFAVNIPAATGSGEGGAIGLSLGSVGGNFNINLRLSALEDAGTIRIISAPKITVLNNREAKISQGVSIPISVVSAAGTNTQFVTADLALTVTPYVSQRDCAIAMNLNVTKNEPDFVNVGARGDPTILRKEARTAMLVNDGETTVLGGIYTRNTGLAYKKIPLFGDLPVIGWLFKNRRENDDRTEILVFITPKITNKASLRCQ